MIPEKLECLKNPKIMCYRRVITEHWEEVQACLRSFDIVCEEECSK